MSLSCVAASLQRPRIPTLLSAFLTLLNDRLSESIVFPLLPFLLAQFAPDGRTLGLLAGSYALAQFLVTPLIGALSDRYGRRPVISICVAGSVVGLGLFAVTVSLPWPSQSLLPLLLLFTARIIDGISGGTAATASAVLADITPPDKRARAFGLIGVAFGLGFILGPFVGGQLARVAVSLPVWVATGFAALNLLVVLNLLPETHPQESRKNLLLFAARIIDGISGGTAATASAVLADITPPDKRARAFGLIGVAFGLGFILGPFVGGQLARVAVSLPVWVATGFAALNLLVVLNLLPETHPQESRKNLPRKRDLNPFARLSQVLMNPSVGRLCGAFFLFFLAFNGFTAILVLYFKQRFGWGPELATTAFLVVGVVATVVQGGLIGPLVKRFGEWRLTLLGLGLVIIGCLLIPSVGASDRAGAIFTAVGILALGTGLVTPSLRSLVSRRLGREGQGSALGSLQALQSLGSFLGPPLAGFSYDLLGPVSPFAAAATVLVIVIGLVAGSPLPDISDTQPSQS